MQRAFTVRVCLVPVADPQKTTASTDSDHAESGVRAITRHLRI
ncbi:MAG: hypothetical protein ACLR8P_13445 [Clostridium fessum]